MDQMVKESMMAKISKAIESRLIVALALFLVMAMLIKSVYDAYTMPSWHMFGAEAHGSNWLYQSFNNYLVYHILTFVFIGLAAISVLYKKKVMFYVFLCIGIVLLLYPIGA